MEPHYSFPSPLSIQDTEVGDFAFMCACTSTVTPCLLQRSPIYPGGSKHSFLWTSTAFSTCLYKSKKSAITGINIYVSPRLQWFQTGSLCSHVSWLAFFHFHDHHSSMSKFPHLGGGNKVADEQGSRGQFQGRKEHQTKYICRETLLEAGNDLNLLWLAAYL